MQYACIEEGGLNTTLRSIEKVYLQSKTIFSSKNIIPAHSIISKTESIYGISTFV